MRMLGMMRMRTIKRMMSMVMRTGISYLNIWIRMMMMVSMVLSEDEEVVDEDDESSSMMSLSPSQLTVLSSQTTGWCARDRFANHRQPWPNSDRCGEVLLLRFCRYLILSIYMLQTVKCNSSVE